MGAMEDLRCKCGKIICQIEGSSIIIKCRHCKRLIIIETKGIISQGDTDVQEVKVEYR